MTLNTHPARGPRWTRSLMMVTVVALSVSAALAQDVPGAIRTTDGRVIQGNIRWMGVAKAYSVITKEGITLQVPVAQVDDSRVTEPPELKPAIRLVAAGQPDQAIPVLEKIAKDYTMLQHDIPATRWLAQAYLDKGESRKALDACERLIRSRPTAGYASEVALPYWDTLLAEGNTSRLNQMIDKAVAGGTRKVQAIALTKRGAAKQKARDFESALIDGYLRVVTLYSAIKEVQPEALYQAAICMEELGRVTDAQKMRDKLLTAYGRSEYAQKLKGGA